MRVPRTRPRDHGDISDSKSYRVRILRGKETCFPAYKDMLVRLTYGRMKATRFHLILGRVHLPGLLEDQRQTAVCVRERGRL